MEKKEEKAVCKINDFSALEEPNSFFQNTAPGCEMANMRKVTSFCMSHISSYMPN